MGIFKGSATLTRYRVRDNLPPNLADFLDERIRKYSFVSIDDTTEELSVGWCSANDLLDTNFAYASYWLEPYLTLGLRIDRRRVPNALLKKYHRMAIRKVQSANDDKRLSKPEREELKERTRLELLTRMPPTSQLFEVLWDTSGGQVWLGSQANAVREQFEELFARSFQVNLESMWPWRIALDQLGEGSGAARLETATSLTLYKGDAE